MFGHQSQLALRLKCMLVHIQALCQVPMLLQSQGQKFTLADLAFRHTLLC